MVSPFEASRSHLDTTIGRTPLDEWSARRRELCLKNHNSHNTLPAGFEPEIPEIDRPQTHAGPLGDLNRHQVYSTLRCIFDLCIYVTESQSFALVIIFSRHFFSFLSLLITSPCYCIVCVLLYLAALWVFWWVCNIDCGKYGIVTWEDMRGIIL